MSTGYARLKGTWYNPHLEVRVDPKALHPYNGEKTMLQFMEWLGARWMYRGAFYMVNGTRDGLMPQELFERAGIEIDLSETYDPQLAAVKSLNELFEPVVILNDARSGLLARHRLAGYDEALRRLGKGALWDKKNYRLEMPIADALVNGEPRPGVIFLGDVIEAARENMARVHTRADIAVGVSDIARATSILDINDEEAQRLIEAIGDVPAWFGGGEIELFPYQRVGAMAVAAGHTGLFDEPGVGKSLQALAAAAIVGARRVVIAAPPVVLTHWGREVERSGLHTLGSQFPGEIVIISSKKRKEPELPEFGVVVLPDSLLGARPALLKRMLEWEPDVVILDEAHRIKTATSARAKALIALGSRASKFSAALTGTPIFQSPQEIVALLDFTGHLGPVFGGSEPFLERYCYQNNFNAWIPRKTMLTELRQKLEQHVWVRRTKSQVLPNLPKKLRSEVVVDVDLKDYREVHKNVIDHIAEWVEKYYDENKELPDEKEIGAYAKNNLRYVSMLRVAAAMAKIDVAAERIRDFVVSAPERPLIVWVHHHEVGEAMLAALDSSVGRSGLIDGRTNPAEKDELIDSFQEGKVAVLVCSITAVGVGVTLTRSQDHLFVETDWTPAIVVQAEDRSHRYGAVSDHLFLETMVAIGTLDEHIQSALLRKGKTLRSIYGEDSDTEVAVLDGVERDLETPTEIMFKLIAMAIEKTARAHKIKGAF